MNMQAWIGQRSFNCYVGNYVWVQCKNPDCKKMQRVARQVVDFFGYCSNECFYNVKEV